MFAGYNYKYTNIGKQWGFFLNIQNQLGQRLQSMLVLLVMQFFSAFDAGCCLSSEAFRPPTLTKIKVDSESPLMVCY